MNRFTLALHILIGKPLALTDAIQLIYRTEDYRQRKDLIDPNLVSVRPYTRRHKSTRAEIIMRLWLSGLPEPELYSEDEYRDIFYAEP